MKDKATIISRRRYHSHSASVGVVTMRRPIANDDARASPKTSGIPTTS